MDRVRRKQQQTHITHLQDADGGGRELGEREGERLEHELDLGPELVRAKLVAVLLKERVRRAQHPVDHVKVAARKLRRHVRLVDPHDENSG